MRDFCKKAYRFVTIGCIILVLTMVAVRIFFSKHFDAHGFFPLPLMLVFLVLFSLICLIGFKMTNDELSRLIHLLDEECDPLGYLAGHEYAYKKALKIRRGNMMPYALLERQDHAVALSDLGEHDQAIQVLEPIIAAKAKPQWLGAVVIAHTSLASVYLARDGANSAEKALEQLRLATERIGQTKDAAMFINMQGFSSSVTLTEYQIDALKGQNLDAALDYFKKSVSSTATLREQLFCRRYLAMIYEKQGHAEQARAEYEIIAARGNRLFIAAEARERLAAYSGGSNGTAAKAPSEDTSGSPEKGECLPC